jgi:LacI family transcriptional regulator
MPVTLRQIAKQAGVATSTVSRVLNNKTDGTPITSQCVERILKIAEQMNYRPNISARATRTGRTGCIAVVLSQNNHSYISAGLLGEIHRALEGRNLHLVVARLPDEKVAKEGFVSKLMREWFADGLLVYYPDHVPQGMVETVRRYNIPCIWMNFKLPVDAVHPDDMGAGRRATEHLIRQGHRDIVYVDYSHSADELVGGHYSARDRQAGYEQGMYEAGLEPRVIRSHVPGTRRRDFSFEWLKAPNRPTGIVCYAPSASTPIICAGFLLGLRPGHDYSIITFDDKNNNDLGVRVTTFTLPQAQIAQTSLKMLLEKIDDPARLLSSCAIPFGVLEGDTCKPPPAPQQ